MKTNKYLLYGSSISTVDEVHELFEKLSGLKFILRHSSYIGKYSQLDLKNGNVKIQSNYLDNNGELMEESFQDIKTLVYVTAEGSDEAVIELTSRMCAEVSKFQLLREQDI